MFFGFEEGFFPGVADTSGLLGWDSIMGQLMGVDAGQQFGPAPDLEDTLAQERAQGALVGRINIGWRNEVGAQEVGQFLRIDAVVLVLATVDHVDVERVAVLLLFLSQCVRREVQERQ